MTKKHFVAAAEIVTSMKRDCDTYSRSDCKLVAERFIELFESFDSRFDRERFLAACGLE